MLAAGQGDGFALWVDGDADIGSALIGAPGADG